MTVGSGILWSTVLLLIALGAYLISVRGKWRTVGKVAVGLFGVSGVLLSAAWGWNRYEQRAQVVEELDGVRLGMSPLDVKLRKGAPQNGGEDAPTKDGDTYRVGWLYHATDNGPFLAVIFSGKSPSALQATIVCEQDGYNRPMGLGRYTSEDEIVDKLGRPTAVSIASNGLSKIISFEPYKVAFSISKGVVTEVCVTSSGVVSYTEEYDETNGASAK